jgi:hypothetical protein
VKKIVSLDRRANIDMSAEYGSVAIEQAMLMAEVQKFISL